MGKNTLFGILLLLFFVIPSIYAAESGSTTLSIPVGKWWTVPELAEQLNLKEAEKKKLDDLYIVFHRRLIDRKAVMEKLWLDIDTLLGKEEFNESAALEQFRKLEAERSAIAMDRFQFLVTVRKILGRGRYERLKALFEASSKK